MQYICGKSMVENVNLIPNVFGRLIGSEYWLDCSRSRKVFCVTTHLPISHTPIPFTCISHKTEVRVPHVPHVSHCAELDVRFSSFTPWSIFLLLSLPVPYLSCHCLGNHFILSLTLSLLALCSGLVCLIS